MSAPPTPPPYLAWGEQKVHRHRAKFTQHPTWLEVSEWQLSSQQFPQHQGEAEDVSLHTVLGALGEDLRSHPSQILEHHTQHINSTLSAQLISSCQLNSICTASQLCLHSNSVCAAHFFLSTQLCLHTTVKALVPSLCRLWRPRCHHCAGCEGLSAITVQAVKASVPSLCRLWRPQCHHCAGCEGLSATTVKAVKASVPSP